jgi:hypothetical protein
MPSPYVEQRLAETGDVPKSRRTQGRIRHASVELKRQIRDAYLAKCPCCGTRPTMRQLAQKHDLNEATVWRAINEPIIDRFRSPHVKRSFKRISPLQVAALLCEGVDEGRNSL